MSDYFDPYIFDYKTYVKETYGLNEMPTRLACIAKNYEKNRIKF